MIRVANAPFNAGVHDQAQVELPSAGQPRRHRPLPGRQPIQAAGRGLLGLGADGRGLSLPLEFVRGTQAMIDRVFQMESTVTL